MNSTTKHSTRVQAPANPDPISNHVSSETNDRSPLNSTEQGLHDRGEKGTPKLMKCKRPTIYSTFNVRTISKTSRQQELVSCAARNKIDVISIQEHRFYHPDTELKYTTIDNYQLITASASKNSQGSTIGGVGLLLSPKALDNLLKVEKISDRILVAEFNSNPITSVIACYSPTNTSDDYTVDAFYHDLKGVTENIPAHNFLVIAGDFNSQVGPEDAAFTFNKLTNRNGEKLQDFAQEFQLTLTNTKFMKSRGKMWTHQHPAGTRSQIDYILIRNKWKNSVRNCQAYSSFSSVGSDHRIVSCTTCLSLRSSKKPNPNPMKCIDWKMVSSNPDIKQQYALDVKNRFDALSNTSDDVETSYNNLIESTQEIALSTLPKKDKVKSPHLSSHNLVSNARKNIYAVKKLYTDNPTKVNFKKVTKAQTQLDEAYAIAEAEFIQGKIDDITHLHVAKQHAAAWKTINELTGRKSKPSIKLKGGSQENRKANWLSHFRSLLGEQPKTPANLQLRKIQVSEELDISTDPFTLLELQTVLKSLSNNKAPGLDNIPTILWKDPIFHDLLLQLCNTTFLTHAPPSAWLKGGIIPVPKKGDLTSASNYRGITLIPIAAKIYNKLLLNRLVPAIDPLLRSNQNGFRRGRSTISQILSIRRIIEEMRKYNRDLVMLFVDFRKAFDSIDRDVMFEILPLYGIPLPIISAIKALYTNTSATIITPDGETNLFEIVAGVLQGDTLAPFLFILVLDYVLRLSLDSMQEKGIEIQPRRSRRYPAEHLTDLDFADDLALFSQSVKDAESLLHSLEQEAAKVGLYCNESKTKFICTTTDPLQLKSSSGITIDKVDDFKYLGSFIMDSGKDFRTRKAMAWDACNKLEAIWRSNIGNKIKIKLFCALVEPILLFGAETWTLTTRLQQRLDGTYTNLLRRVQNIHWREHATLKIIYGDLPPISARLIQKRTQFAGHCQRATGEAISSLLLWKPTGRVFSRKLTFPGVIARDTGLEIADLDTAMQNRDVWREIVQGLTPTAYAAVG